jgi:outer membrane protein assembly factor BamE (lipoprotein component of BamABCDE complex)
MKRKVAAVAAAILAGCLCVALAVLLTRGSRPAVTKAHFDRITVGMSKAEVQEIFGRPASSTSAGGRTWPQIQGIQGVRTSDGVTHEVWGGEDGAAIIGFDERDRTVHTHWTDSPAGVVTTTLRIFGID